MAPGIVRWLQTLIPVLRDAPDDVEIDVEITHKDAADPGRLDDPG